MKKRLMDMKRWPILLALAASCTVMAQELRPVKIQIRHADPWLVKAMLEGQPVMSPEISTVMLLAGMGGAGQAASQATAGTPMFPEGTLMVNPSDNSLWFVPRRQTR